MVSSLAEQLARTASVNANLLHERTRKQAASESYLFSSKEARQHDLDSLHALGVNGFLQLKSMQPELAPFEQSLFSGAAKSLDRTLQPAEQNAALDATIAAFLALLGPLLLEAPTGKVLEWLVRRFRIHEFNVPSIVSLFLPYHETPHFTKMVSILHIGESSPLRFLQAYKTTAKPLHRQLLISDMLSKPEVARFTVGILPEILTNHGAGMHRALIAFHVGVLLEFVAKIRVLDENVMAIILPSVLEPLQSATETESNVKQTLLHETILGSYLVLAAISQKTRLADKALKTMLATVVSCAERVSPKQLVRTLVSLCAPQDQLDQLPGSVLKGLLSIAGIGMELVNAMTWTGSEKLLNPLIEKLILRSEDVTAQSTLETIVTSSELLPAVAHSAAAKLILCIVEDDSASQSTLTWRRLLSQLHQRQPKAVQAASQVLTKADEDVQEAVDQIMLSLSVPFSGATAADSETATLLVGSANADTSIRATSVHNLITRLSEDGIAEAEIQSVSSTLLLRVHDTSAQVLQALYTTAPEVVARAFLHSAPESAYLEALQQALHSTSAKPTREVIRAHLHFLLTHFLPLAYSSSSSTPSDGPDGAEQPAEESEEHRERTRRITVDILMPFLLYSKPRMKTAQAVWEILETIEGERIEGVSFELLGGCIDAVRWEQAKSKNASTSKRKKQKKDAEKEKETEKDGESVNTELLTRINIAVAAKIADNILASNYFQVNLGSVLEQLHSQHAHARALAFLITRALLNRLSGEQRVEAGHLVLQAMKLETLEGMGDFMRGVVDFSAFLSDDSVGSAVVLKPNSQNTLHRLEVSVLSVLPNFPRPSGIPLEWIAKHPLKTDGADSHDARATRYIELLRAVYRPSNSSPSLPLLSTHLLRLLFINLGDDALSFLAGIWLTTTDSEEHSTHVQYAALRHACAFLEAHVATQRTLDFQTILPAMLVMLQSDDASVREAAIRCIAVVIKLSHSQQAEAVYAFDVIYGNGSAHLQYLDWADLQKYLQAVADNRENLMHDPEYLQVFHREHLVLSKGESKRIAGYKQRVLCYLLSHVNGCPLLRVKSALLRSVDGVTNEVKAQVLMPTIEGLLSTPDGHDQSSHQRLQEFLTFAVSVFDASSIPDLNDPDKAVWALYEKLLVTSLKNSQWIRPRDALLYRLQHRLYAKLSMERKAQLCRTLLQVGTRDESVAPICKQTLCNVLNEVPLIVQLLLSLQPQAGADPAAPMAKRPRMEKTLSHTTEDLSTLSILAEVLGSIKVSESLELVSCLLETLYKVVNNVPSDVADRRFVEQLLMAAIENVVENLPPAVNVAPGSIRVDTLVEILRTSENPQTFHQACLLMASLARIAPDAVLHNVMPVFTFMGSNVFHRDDTYSFRVVQKTVDSIVPVMVSSLKEVHGSGMALHHASREFLRVFTNAANHVPRHRRINFFAHLVDTLGPADFLAPVTMLLVDRVSNRVARQSPAEFAGSLFLPLAVCERYAAQTQLSSFVEVAHEVQRLSQHGDVSVQPFLEDIADDEQTHAEMTARRRATALLAFCDHAMKRLHATSLKHSDAERNTGRELLSLFISVSTANPGDESHAEVSAAAREAMASTLRVMSAQDFVAGIVAILQSGSIHAQSGALELLAERLTQVADDARRTLTPSIITVVETIKIILSAKRDANLITTALQALATITHTLAPGEESSITATVSLVMNCIAQQPLRATAFQTLLAYSAKLGPRTIPFLKDIVKTCVLYAKEAVVSQSSDASVLPAASSVLRNLLTSIPTFWGETELLSVVQLYLDGSQASVTDASELSVLIKTTAKRASPNVLLPALCNMWTRSFANSTQYHPKKILAFIHAVKVSIKAASRPAVLENIRELFKTFLSMFDLCVDSGDAELEGLLTSAFTEIVVKLNETAFRPIFRKMFDWAFTGEPSTAIGRQVVFCHVYSSLLDFFKALMVPYMSFAWQTFLERLGGYATEAPEDGRVWLTILQTLSKSMAVDEDRAFWRSDKLRQLAPVAIKQLPIAPHVNVAQAKETASECLTSLLALVEDDVLAKSINLDVLMQSRSEDVRVRLLSLTCAEQLWRVHGDKLLGFVAETATFIAEAAEDENDRVVQGAHRLKAAVESIGGTIDIA